MNSDLSSILNTLFTPPETFSRFEEPIRAETFSAARMETHAESLAHAQSVTLNPRRGKSLTGRIIDNRRVLEGAYLAVLDAVEEKRSITPAAEWLIDNFHIVRAQLHDIREHLPAAFYNELPKLAEGHLAGYPRVYGIAWAFMAHTDCRFDAELLTRFLQAYQRVQPLTIGELWALPITIRVVMIENLRRLSVRIVGSQIARAEADLLANELLGLREVPGRPLDVIVKSLGDKPFLPAYAVQLLQRLRFQDARFNPVLEWLERQLARDNHLPDEIVKIEHNSQTAANASVRNIITSSRFISSFSWPNFVEDVSLVDHVLRQHPRFAKMDFVTRNRYRGAIEELARRSPLSELEVARRVLAEVQAPLGEGAQSDVGYYLVSSGRHELERKIGFRPGFYLALLRFYRDFATVIYLGAIASFTLLLLVLLYGAGESDALGSVLTLAFLTLAMFPCSVIAVALINRLTTALLGPRNLARLSLEEGLPVAGRTIAVVPTLLTDVNKVEAQLEELEIHFLSNPDDELYLALLTDWTDSPTEHRAGDEELLSLAAKKLRELNAKYPLSRAGHPRFYVLHRKRLYNAGEGKWMGWERKRGKLHELNQLLLGNSKTSHIAVGGEAPKVPGQVRYVITLDADTRLPNGTVKQLVGTMLHPLNLPEFDPVRRVVTRGYGILQPRMTPTLPSSQDSTIFQYLSTGPCGIDPYAFAISDVYQDLFGEGSFMGKGIYDVAVFERAMAGRVPENALLSHDLFEGNCARAGFLSDVEFFEDFPSHTQVAAARVHRWTRGDWQLLPWIFGRLGHGISLIGRWKMIDNLRRSLVAPATFVLLLGALTLAEGALNRWFLVCLVSLATPLLVTIGEAVFVRKREVPVGQQLRDLWWDCELGVARLFMDLTLLPARTWMSLEAISLALIRSFVTHRYLLEWTTAAQAKSTASLSLRSFWRDFRGALGLVAIGILLCARVGLPHADLALPFLLLWLGSPLLAWVFSSPPKALRIRPLGIVDAEYLRGIARRTWGFFETFVTAEDHFLPPDNFQEDPSPVVAHRSSPTNFGLYLLSTLAARDFGWIGTGELATRLSATLGSMKRLPRYQGHFYNWYETREARALDPKYISSVDNGNLAGHLLAVGQGCLEALERPVAGHSFHTGAQQTLSLVQEAAANLHPESPLRLALAELAEVLEVTWPKPGRQLQYCKVLRQKARAVHRSVRELAEPTPEIAELRLWSRALRADLLRGSREFEILLGWTDDPGKSVSRVSLQDLASHCAALASASSEGTKALARAARRAADLCAQLRQAHADCHELFQAMDFKLLYDPVRKLFSIGYRVAEHELDASYYDLLASECRLTSFIAVAKGDVPAAHWFHLGRGLSRVPNGAVLVSWSGSMFEYLMPSLVMHAPRGSLLEQTCQLAVRRQIAYGLEHALPWGISESAYNERDLHLTYQYSNFGVPDLGLKRGLGADQVVAPYATVLAVMYQPALAVENLHRLAELGGRGCFGFFEAIDFTPSRLRKGTTSAVVKAYMAHHQGMSLVAIANSFGPRSGNQRTGRMRDRFHAEPIVQAAELLLQERTPRNVGVQQPGPEVVAMNLVKEDTEHLSRRYHTVDRPVPTTQILASGEYSVMVTSSGSGFSRYGDRAVTRWREDVTRDDWGTFFYLRDCASEQVWSAGYQPTCVGGEIYEANFAEDRVHIAREDFGISCDMEIFLSPEDNAEVRRLTLTNKSERTREIEITSFAEVALNSHLADVSHPAFFNLFVQTEFYAEANALLATRRARSDNENPLWMAHVLLNDRHAVGAIQYETDRAQFLGRQRSVRNPQAIYAADKLSGSLGAVLDPAFSLRTRVRLEPGVTAHVTFSTIVARSRDEIILRAEKFQDPAAIERVTNLAWTQAQVKLHYLNIDPDESHLFQRLLTRLLYSESSLRPSGEVLKLNHRPVRGLWGHGISGDFPIVVLRIDNFEDRGILRQLLKAHEYYGLKNLSVDLVILNDQGTSYAQELQSSLEAMVQSAVVTSHGTLPQARGKVFVLRTDRLSHDDRLLLYTSARATFSSRQGSLSEQVKRVRMTPAKRPKSNPRLRAQPVDLSQTLLSLKFKNGIGGFSEDGREYVIILAEGENTPAPWVNVIANEKFGFQVSEVGAGYTWSLNSRENQLTPWSNDPVVDPGGEAFYIRDRDSNAVWCPAASPIRVEGATYITRHGQGYSRFEHFSHGIRSELTQFVPVDLAVKVTQLSLENTGEGPRRLQIYAFVEWVLGFSRAQMAPTTITEIDETTRAIFAHNSRSEEFGQRVAFATFREGQSEWTGDRTEFIGRNGNLASPAALFGGPLSGQVGAAFDPCAALVHEVHLAPGQRIEISFYLGQAETREAARACIATLNAQSSRRFLEASVRNWDSVLNKVQVETPDVALNFMLNRWLLYQTLSCRFWARAAFYQAGGAFGFRDQLQDSMALVTALPQVARAHILRAARRQFVEGDVQHWWHPPTGRGVRTHISDDLVWLAFVVKHYLEVTGDLSILDEELPFLEGPTLRADQDDSYYTPNVSHNSASLFEHCARALDLSLRTGAHGLPLMGSGDWNDGMNRVGHEGRGESVWLAWFLLTNLKQFAPVASRRGEKERAQRWLAHAEKLRLAVEQAGWDGEWYRRAYFDDGSPLGTASDGECRIDSLTQTWAVLSGAADPERAKKAMAAVGRELLNIPEDIVLLFAPPFDRTTRDPGYIKGYLPGVRENGAQYTHAAVWCVIAYAQMGDGDRAHQVFTMLNPITHGDSVQKIARYKIEPYVLAADIYSVAPYTGRGGWSWYTGSSGWMYRAGVESILGVQPRGEFLYLKPCAPAAWKEFSVRYVHGTATYRIHFQNRSSGSAGTSCVQRIQVDGQVVSSRERISLIDDGEDHLVFVELGATGLRIDAGTNLT